MHRHGKPATAPKTLHRFSFTAMASPCEILLHHDDQRQAELASLLAINEVRRLEAKYSRYQPSSVTTNINTQAGAWTTIDAETGLLLDFADSAYQLSDGLFDISSGILRQVWQFDGSDNVPSAEAVNRLLPHVGWPQIQRRQQNGGHQLKLPVGMELDFGGFVKEYAADRALLLMNQHLSSTSPCLVNLGGDIATNGATLNERGNAHVWSVGIEAIGLHKTASTVLRINSGAIATSGDARKFLLKDSVRYSHILNPKTGWPVIGAPSTVTVAANSCLEAGLLSTVALLHGTAARAFLEQQGRQYWLSL